jgi:hypothetical protein
VADISAADLLRAVTEFYFDYGDVHDRRQTAAWIEFFGDEAIYSLTTYRNATTKGMYLIFEKGRAAVTRRAALASGYLRAQRNKALHMISNIRVIEVDGSGPRLISQCSEPHAIRPRDAMRAGNFTIAWNTLTVVYGCLSITLFWTPRPCPQTWPTCFNRPASLNAPSP